MSREVIEEINLNGHIEFQVQLQLNASGSIESSKVYAVGGHEFLQKVQSFRESLQGPLESLMTPEGSDMADMLIREMVLRLKGEWSPPYTDLNICHCRAIPTAKVDQAIIYGAHTAQTVSKMTSSSTACGTCRPDVELMIKFRTGK
ncbi:MAG: (2Fe-2S)-binding protein [Bdellovibrionales bacterium]